LRKIESIEVFSVLLPMIETFQFASGSAGGDVLHVFVTGLKTSGTDP
jgi:hypothetical protein